MTTQQDERARLINGLRDLRDVDFDDLFVKAAALLEADAQAGGEVALWVSPGQFENLKADHDDESGTYLPVRHTSRGKFTMPLYTRPQPQAVAQGWKLVPVEPTDAMVVQGLSASGRDVMESDVEDIYRAMLSASPEAPAAAHDDAALQALGWQRISCPVCGADGARAAPAAAQVAQPLIERNARRWRFALIESPEWSYAVCRWDGRDNEWLPITREEDIRAMDAFMAAHLIGKDQA